ncbi:AMP phosphorylase [Thermogladius sp. KZ2Tp1]|uniref:AMP phosphorylase n=1 Tax=Thermogladius sp. KZ2Tp1 TaxID=3136289 RepID=UPI003DA96E3B
MLVSKEVRNFTAGVLEVSTGSPLLVVNEQDALEMSLTPHSKVLVKYEDREAYATVTLTKTMVAKGRVLASIELADKLGLKEGYPVQVKPAGLPGSYAYLLKRIRGERLSYNEMYSIIRDVVNGAYGEAEIAAFLLSQQFYVLDEDELTSLIKAMVETGVKISFDEPVFDEHSIGGVPGNSKVAMVAVPIVASFGLLIPKTSSRAITSPAGTADTMEVLARVDFTAEEIRELAKKTRGLLVWGGKLNLAPADDIFVNVERKLSIDPWHQMVASILSKKLAMSVESLVIDIPVGKKAKIEEPGHADQLAGLFIRQAAKLGMRVKVAITFGGQPIGMSVGPALEAKEALEALLNRRGSRSLVDKAVLIAGLTMELSGKVPPGQGESYARELFSSGRAYEKFKEIIEAQGGNPNIKPEEVPLGKYTYTFKSPLEGAVTYIDNAAVTMVARAAGAPFDKGAGVQFHAKVGYRVNKGDPLFTLYSNSESRLEEAISLASKYSLITVEGMLLKTLP